MLGEYLSIENAKKLENYDKLFAKNQMLESNALAYENIIKDKNKTIEKLRNQIKEQNKLIDKLKNNTEQLDIFGG